MENIINMLIDTSLKKINFIFNLIQNEIEKYLSKNLNEINYRVKVATIEFTDEQKEKWENLCKSYENTKNEIIKLNI